MGMIVAYLGATSNFVVDSLAQQIICQYPPAVTSIPSRSADEG